MTVDKIVEKLPSEHGIIMGYANSCLSVHCGRCSLPYPRRTTLSTRINEMGLYTSRQPHMTQVEQGDAILEKMADDPLDTRGYRDVWNKLKNGGTPMPRFVTLISVPLG
jgi:hypothetical protein